MAEEPVLDLDTIQGMIVPGFRKPSQTLVHFCIEDAIAARVALAYLADSGRLSSARAVLKQHRRFKSLVRRLGREPYQFTSLFMALAFTATGLRKLVPPEDIDRFGDASFLSGLAANAGTLGDLPGSAEDWIVGGAATPVDAMFVLASDDAEKVENEAFALIGEMESAGLRRVHVDVGHERPGDQAGHERFGFRDGISMLGMRGRASDAPDDYVETRDGSAVGYDGNPSADFSRAGMPLLWPGQILFGHDRQDRDDAAASKPGDRAVGPEWAQNGAYLVYRRLRQDVDAFERFLDEGVRSLNDSGWSPPITVERLGALLVGRWKSGAPLALYPDGEPGGGNPTNDFGFNNQRPAPGGPAQLPQGADLDGFVCPRGAHVRKVNPRDLTTDQGQASRTFARLPLRRGITYSAGDPASPDEGLLFLAFHSSIIDSFEFLMKTWVRRPEKPESSAGVDAILGGGTGRSIKLKNGGADFDLPVPGGWVVPTGGEYFFMPSLGFIASL